MNFQCKKEFEKLIPCLSLTSAMFDIIDLDTINKHTYGTKGKKHWNLHLVEKDSVTRTFKGPTRNGGRKKLFNRITLHIKPILI